ncbi:serine hydrolase, partial [Escherichia coli]|nr:serine hydrolase [Escherichia coli]
GDTATKYAPKLAGSSFDNVSMLDLGTYTAGGLPLQFPDSVTDHKTMIDYFKNWKPDYPAGTQRRYSNPSIGLFGYLAAQSMGEPFDKVMETRLIPAFGLKHTFIQVPESQMKNYAYGYSKANKPIRVSPGAFDAQAYGIETTAPD